MNKLKLFRNYLKYLQELICDLDVVFLKLIMVIVGPINFGTFFSFKIIV